MHDQLASLWPYPNPASSVMRYSRTTLEAAWVEVLDLTGKRALRIGDLGSGSLDVSGLSPGAYFLRLTDARGAIISTAHFIRD